MRLLVVRHGRTAVFVVAALLYVMARLQAWPHVVIRSTSSSSLSTSTRIQIPPHHLSRLTGNLSLAHLPSLPYCVNYQIRGVEGILSSHEAQQYLSTRDNVPLGIVTVEDPTRFISLTKHVFHLYLFLEFLVMAFAEVQQISPLTVQWWYSPLLTRSEICGMAQDMNCLLMNYFLFYRYHQHDDDKTATVYGLEANSPTMQAWHPAYRGEHLQRAKFGDAFVSDRPAVQTQRHDAMLAQVDVITLIHRERCQGKIGKMWASLHQFPAAAWHETLQAALAFTTKTRQPLPPPQELPSSSPRLIVGYIDRQNTQRRLPDVFHNWLVDYLHQDERIEFWQLHMEDYEAATQLHLASQLQVMMGVHGNGLSHQVWMSTPMSTAYVMEFYWDVPFSYAYPLAAQLWNHSYQGLYNGHVLDQASIQNRNPSMRSCCAMVVPPQDMHWNLTASQEAVQSFLERALQEHGYYDDTFK